MKFAKHAHLKLFQRLGLGLVFLFFLFSDAQAQQKQAVHELQKATTTGVFDEKGEPLEECAANLAKVNWKVISRVTSPEYRGVGQLVSDAGNCTVTFIKPGSSSPTSAQTPAYGLTAGHCIQHKIQIETSRGRGVLSRLVPKSEDLYFPLDKDEVLLHKAPEIPLTAVFNNFQDSSRSTLGQIFSSPLQRLKKEEVDSVEYASASPTYDVAIIKFKRSYAELVKDGVVPLTLASDDLKIGDAIDLISIPGSSNVNLEDPMIVPNDEKYLHRSSCEAGWHKDQADDLFKELADGRVVYLDLMSQFIPTNCSALHGSSGGPMVKRDDHRVYAWMTRSISFIDKKDPMSANPWSFAIPVSLIRGCFNAAGVFDSKLSGCHLSNSKGLPI